MSILVALTVSEGLIFGADRNITVTHSDGRQQQGSQQPKVFKWPTDKFLFGFVGAAQVGGLPMDEWLSTLKEEFQHKLSLEEIACELQGRVQDQRSKDEGNNPAEPLIIHIGGFEVRDGFWIPQVWHIGNSHKLGHFGYLDFRKEFFCKEELQSHFEDIDPSEIRQVLKVMAKQFKPLWFHQGIDLNTFNVLESAIRSSFELLCKQHPEHAVPTTLNDWAKHVCMQILMYGAYFKAFHPEDKQYVGGGVDVVCMPWPE